MKEQTKIWTDFIAGNQSLIDSQKKFAIEYVKNILEKDGVIIFERKHLSVLLGIDIVILNKMIAMPDKFYYSFTIPKRNGQKRTISAPYPALLHIQKWIYNNLLLSQRLSESAKGFVPNLNIADNARPHLNHTTVLKLDIIDFFPSISKQRIIEVFRYMGYTHGVAYALASLCCKNSSLPQGAPTSPYLSNIVAKRMDKRLMGLCEKFHITYTRYADDLTFSANDIPARFIEYVSAIIQNEGFEINQAKTKLQGPDSRKIITGLSISSGKLTIPRSTKREIRKIIGNIKIHKLSTHKKNIGSNDPIYRERLLGYLFFWKSIEPDNEYVQKAISIVKGA